MLTGNRQEIADALDGQEDVHGFPARPKSSNVGDAWPVLGPIERDEDTGQFIVTWRIYVLLPNDQDAADAWIDGHLDDLHDVLQPVVYIDRFEPVELSPNTQRALLIEARSEP